MSLRDRVFRGVKLLDEKVPNWPEKVNLKTLDMLDFRKCLLTQLFEDYIVAIKTLDIQGETGEFGFDLTSKERLSPERFGPRLQKLWKSIIKASRF